MNNWRDKRDRGRPKREMLQRNKHGDIEMRGGQ